MAWFKNWFNTSYYHLLYNKRDFQEAEIFIDNLVAYLQPKQGAKFFDLACGKGRHSMFLNKKGFDVVGVDLSEESILSAKHEENETLHFAVHDMREVFENHSFDVVVNLFTSFGYFDDDQEDVNVLKAVTSVLKEDGFFVLDYLNAKQVVKNLKTTETIQREDVSFEITKKVENSFVVKGINFQDKGKSYHFEEQVKLIGESEFEEYFRLAGLRLLAKFGDYNLEGFDEDKSPRLILIAEKIG
jgi:SAM-dependent methyltransferase